MQPAYQQHISGESGDCWRCCIASILEVEPEAVPNFRVTEAENMFAVEEWLASKGLALLELHRGKGEDDVTDRLRFDHLCGAFAIASVPSQRFPGKTHAVVVRFEPKPDAPNVVRIVVAHDPNPGNAPYDPGALRFDLLWFIVPVRPMLGEPTRYDETL